VKKRLQEIVEVEAGKFQKINDDQYDHGRDEAEDQTEFEIVLT
jgi:hypothetical protein